MLCSEGLLCAFLATWLIGQWRNEEDNLRKDLRQRFVITTRQVTDSIIKARLMKPLTDAGVTPAAGTSLTITDEAEGMPIGVPLKPAVFVRKSIWSNGRDSIVAQEEDSASVMQVLEGVQVLVNSIFPDSVQRQLNLGDTASVRRRFAQDLAKEGRHFRLRWMKRGDFEESGAIVLSGEGANSLKRISLTGYRPFLFQKILPEMLFALMLVSITAFAFFLAMRSLSKERRLSLMRSSLVSNMSHELKTPVTTVKVALEAMGDDAVLQDRTIVREYVAIASQELQRLELLIDQTLHTSLLETGKLSIQRTREDLRSLTETLSLSLSLRFEKQQARIGQSFEGTDFCVAADKLHVQGVLLNLLDNALKYGGTGVCISISGITRTTGIELSVSDNGPGIPKAYHSRVFEKFFRVPSGNIHNVKGYGLGLSYAAEVMRLHGGSISVSNNDTGGSTFTLHFPKEQQV